MPSNTKENGFETLIVNWLVNENGYEQGTNADYNQEYAIDEERYHSAQVPVHLERYFYSI